MPTIITACVKGRILLMNDAACSVFQDLINLSVRMMPIFLCLEPKTEKQGNHRGLLVYLWVIMIFTQSLFHIPTAPFGSSRPFFVPFFSAALIFFQGSEWKKLFFTCQPGCLPIFSSFLNHFYSLVLHTLLPWSEEQLCTSCLSAQCLALLPVRAFLDEKRGQGRVLGVSPPLFPAVSCLSGSVLSSS